MKKARHLDRLHALLLHPVALPVVIVAILSCVNYVLWYRADSLGRQLARNKSRIVAQQIGSRIRLLLTERTNDLAQCATGYRSVAPERRIERFAAKADEIIAHNPLFHVINLIDSAHVIRSSVPKGKRPELTGLDLSRLPDRERFHREAFRGMAPLSSPAFLLTTGRPGIVIWIPVADEPGTMPVLIAGAVHIDSVIERALESVDRHRYHVAIDLEGRRVFPAGHRHPMRESLSSRRGFTLATTILGRRWTVFASARNDTSVHNLFARNRAMFGIGLGLSVLIGGLLSAALAGVRRNRRHFREIAASEERFRRLSAAAPIGIFLTDEHGATTWVNPAWTAMSGLDEAQSMGMGFAHVIHPDDREALLAAWERAARAGHDFEAEPRLVRPDGQERWVHVRATRMHTPSGEVLGFVGAILDITDRKQADLLLRQSEEKYRTLVEMFPHSITILQEGLVVFASEPTLRIFGFESMDDVLGKDMFRVVAPAERERLRCFAARRTRGEPAPDRYETVMLRANGETFPVEVIIRPITYRGKPAEQVITADITERKQAEEAIRRSEENLAVTLNSIGDAVIATDKHGAVVRMNPVAEQLTGWRVEEARGRPLEAVFVVINAFTRERVESPVSKVLREGKVVGLANHSIIVHREGAERQIADSGAPIRNLEGEVIGVVLVFQDVTEQYRLEEQLRQAQKMEVVGRLAGGIAHDFNNLLTPILGYSEMALLALDEGSDLHADIREINDAAERATGLVSQLLAFSRKQILDIKPVDVNRVVDNLRTMLRRIIGEDIETVLHTDPEPLIVRADVHQLEQIVLNLAVNARDAMADGGVLTIKTARIEIDESFTTSHAEMKPGPHALLTVTDTGEGMTPEVATHIFEPFFTTKGVGEGTGLGLATVYGIIKQHEGGVQVHSVPGTGTTFTIYLPLQSDGREDAVEHFAAARVVAGGEETILLVEDEAMVRSSARRILERSGYTVLEAGGGRAALTIAGEHDGPIHLILTDVVMPDMNGRQLYENVAALRPDVRVLYMSGYTENVIASRGILDEGIAFVQKPFTVETLTCAIREVLENRGG